MRNDIRLIIERLIHFSVRNGWCTVQNAMIIYQKYIALISLNGDGVLEAGELELFESGVELRKLQRWDGNVRGAVSVVEDNL